MDIFVGSLPFKFKDTDLKELFEKYGEVTSAKIVMDNRTRQNKGFGFVEMAVEKEAHNAIKNLNGSEQLGRVIIVASAEKNKDGEKIHQKPRQWNKSKKVNSNIISWD